jgi:hypothetical protein
MTKQEMRFIRRENINKYLQMGCLLCSIKERTRYNEVLDFGYELKVYGER